MTHNGDDNNMFYSKVCTLALPGGCHIPLDLVSVDISDRIINPLRYGSYKEVIYLAKIRTLMSLPNVIFGVNYTHELFRNVIARTFCFFH